MLRRRRVRLPDGRVIALDRAAARALARSGTVPGGPEWVARAEELARPVAREEAPQLSPAQRERLAALAHRLPGLGADGPRAATGGGWQMFLGGLPGGAFVLEYAALPEEAVMRAIERAEALTAEEPPARPGR